MGWCFVTRVIAMRFVVALLALFFAAPAFAQTATPTGSEGTINREQIYRFPHVADEGRTLAAIVFRAPGDTPRPLVIMNHHTSGDAARNAEPRHGVYPNSVAWFIERGYVVAVLHRRGYGLTGGALADVFACASPNHVRAGRADAADIGSAVDALIQLPFIRKDGVIIVGQSTGGWASIAMAAENHPAVAGIINFAGGRRGTSGQTREVCAIDQLPRDAGYFGRRARTPSLWIYSENDRLFSPNLVKAMRDAYVGAGGKVEFSGLPAFGDDGHSLFPNPRGIPTWGPIVERFILKFR